MSITIRIKPGNPRPKLYINDSINGILLRFANEKYWELANIFQSYKVPNYAGNIKLMWKMCYSKLCNDRRNEFISNKDENTPYIFLSELNSVVQFANIFKSVQFSFKFNQILSKSTLKMEVSTFCLMDSI